MKVKSELDKTSKVNLFSVMQIYLDTPELIRFSLTSKTSKKLTRTELNLRMIDELLLAVVQGNKDKAEKIIKQNPMLLLKKRAEVVDYSGKTIKNKTALQAALINFDDNMAEMIKAYLLKLENGQDELESQFYAIFPKGVKTHVLKNQSQTYDFREITLAVANASERDIKQALFNNLDENHPLNYELKSFRSSFDKVSYSEEIFNPNHFLSAYRCYEENYIMWSLEQRKLFWYQIFGYTQRHLPACFAQAFAQGLLYLVEHGNALKRSFDLRCDMNKKIFPLASRSSGDIGFDFAVSEHSFYKPPPTGVDLWFEDRKCFRLRFISNKNNNIGKLVTPQKSQAKSRVFFKS